MAAERVNGSMRTPKPDDHVEFAGERLAHRQRAERARQPVDLARAPA